MIQEFLQTWPLFAHTYLTGWLLAVLLSMLGVYVVARDQIFVGTAIAQASTLGIALSMVAASCLSAFHLHALEFGATTWAVVFACLAAYVMSLAFGRRESHNAVAAWIFLAGGSLSVLVVAHSPHGLDEIQRLVSSSLIGATAQDTVLFALLTTLTILFLLRHHRTITLLAVDPPMAAATGLRLRRWSTGLALWLGLAVGCSIRSAGLLYTFGSLSLPALTAKALAREIRPLFPLAPTLAPRHGDGGLPAGPSFRFPARPGHGWLAGGLAGRVLADTARKVRPGRADFFGGLRDVELDAFREWRYTASNHWRSTLCFVA